MAKRVFPIKNAEKNEDGYTPVGGTFVAATVLVLGPKDTPDQFAPLSAFAEEV